MFRSVLIIIFVIVILLVVRTVMQRFKSQSEQKTSTSNKDGSKDTVQCLHCKTYIPREDAIFKDDKTFCSTQHLEDWNKSA